MQALSIKVIRLWARRASPSFAWAKTYLSRFPKAEIRHVVRWVLTHHPFQTARAGLSAEQHLFGDAHEPEF